MDEKLEKNIKRLEEIARGECHCRMTGVFREVCKSCIARRELVAMGDNIDYILSRIDRAPGPFPDARGCEPGCDCPACRQKDLESFNREGC